jgi:tetratricopeptide (TPR) repeat protein
MTTWGDKPHRQPVRFAPILFLVGALVLKYRVLAPEDCEHAALGNDINRALVVCREEYLATNDPWTGARLANIWRRSRNFTDAQALATNLLATPARSDALQVLGKIDVSEHRNDKGRAELETARELHVAERRHRAIAADDQALAGILRDEKRYAEALRSLDTCITESREAEDRVVEGYCHVSAGMVLSEIGYYAGAQEEFDLAEPLLVLDRDRADLEIERGTLDLRNGLGPQRLMHIMAAVAEFKLAIRHASAASLTIVQRKAELNLAYALAELGASDPSQTAEASAHLEIARQLDLGGSDADERTMLQARIAYRRHNYTLAGTLNAAVFDRLHEDDDDYRLRVAVLQAEIGLATGSLDDAIAWAQRGVDITEAIRGVRSAIELRPWILSARREPYELLFTALAGAHRVEDAVLAFDHWQGRTLLDQLARGEATPPATLRLAAMHADSLSRLVPALSLAPVVKLASRSELTAALQDADAIALFVASEQVWRISALHGRLDVVGLGPLTALLPLINEFRAHPTRVELGEALGEKLLGREPFRRTDETLFVVLDGGSGGELAGLPVAALRVNGEPLIALRPIVHPARLSALGCVPAVTPRRSLAVADAHGNLADARDEAIELGKTHGFTAMIGPMATSTALFTAGPNDQLHLAVHAVVQPSGGALDLYDRPVSALEISNHRDSPALVFLAACSSAASNDSERATSLATAFLASGSSQVIATLRPVHDSGAAQIARSFYARNGSRDPARKLAEVQATLAKTGNQDWPNFMLYGHDTCRRETR